MTVHSRGVPVQTTGSSVLRRRAEPQLRSAAAIVAALLLLSGCTQGRASNPGPVFETTGATGSATTSGSPPPVVDSPTAWQQVLDRIQPDGGVDLATAVQAFSFAINPLPGAQAFQGPTEQIQSGTIAVNWLLDHWDQLTPAQQNAAQAIQGTEQSATNAQPTRATRSRTTRSAAENPSTPCHTSDSADAGPYRAMMSAIEKNISTHFDGQPMGVPMYLQINHKETLAAGLPAIAYTWPCAGTAPKTDKKFTGCTVHINPSAVDNSLDRNDIETVLTHETMHCFMDARLYAKTPDIDRPPDWFVEGIPTWVTSVLVPQARVGSEWRNYLNKPGMPLFRRAYSAIGFYAHLAETGTNPWELINPMIEARVGNPTNAAWNAAAWAIAAPSTNFLNSWGSTYVQGRYPGTPWTSTGPSLPTYQPALPLTALSDGGQLPLHAPAAAVAVTNVHVDAQIVTVTPGPGANGRISLGQGADATFDSISNPYCTLDPSQCRCPKGSAGEGTTFNHITSGSEYIGVTGGTKAAAVTMTGYSLETFCGRPGETKQAAIPTECPKLDQFGLRHTGEAIGITQGTLCTYLGEGGCVAEVGLWDGIADHDPTASPINLAGTDQAWIDHVHDCYDGRPDAQVIAVVGQKSLSVWTEGTDDDTIRIAQYVLGAP